MAKKRSPKAKTQWSFAKDSSLKDKWDEFKRCEEKRIKAERSRESADTRYARAELREDTASANFWEEAEITFGLNQIDHDYDVEDGTIYADREDPYEDEDEDEDE
jgi:hypothetical protein